MADLTVRKMRFAFEEPIDLDLPDSQLGAVIPMLSLSMTMPHLEPYLIRTMRVALDEITDPQLAEDTRRFSQQEGHHYSNHARLNEQICASFDAGTADALRAIEDAMEADYQRYSRQKSLRFNLAYAEGFEAMTCSSALAMAEAGNFDEGAKLPGGEIWAWHMAEEIEHRTVAFDVFDHLVGSYFYRITMGTWAQWHYLSYIRRFSMCMARGLGRKLTAPSTPLNRAVLRRYVRTWSPRYDPARIEMPAGVDALLARYSAMAERG
jgi:predicted metal-dependent hydrolase